MKIALVGNQNSGKTTLFNLLTGENAKIGNWPGVTIEKKVGKIKGTSHILIDLPGIYSLSPYSLEEEISRKFIFEEKPDVIINIVDSTLLERSLYLTTQLLELDTKIVIALNMTDLLEKKGIKIDINKLEEQLGIDVIKISALKETGIEELKTSIEKSKTKSIKHIFDSKIENAISKIQENLSSKTNHNRFLSIKLLEGDNRFENENSKEIKRISKEVSKNYVSDLEEVIATERYRFIEKVKKSSSVNILFKKSSISDRLDKIFLNRFLAVPIFAVIMFCIYYFSVGVIGRNCTDYITVSVDLFKEKLNYILLSWNTLPWLVSLVTDGIVSGVGAVVSFLPQLFILFLSISILETTGYMSRIAFMLDRIFKKIGLNGKSIIPFIIGSGCSVPAVMGTRIIENKTEKEMTLMLVPFIPCSAKLPIITLFSSYFFNENSGLVSASLYFLSIAIIIVCAFLMKMFVYKTENKSFISELPEYKMPNIKYVFHDSIDKVFSFLKRAGSIILVASIIIWFLLSFSFSFEYGVDVENSILANLGKTFSWIFKPLLGSDSWQAVVSCVQGLVAKEQVISSMSVIAGISENIGMFKSTFSFFDKSSAYAFMVFNLFSAPCFGTIGAMRKELGSTKKVLKIVLFQIVFAYILGVLVYQIGSGIERKTFNISNLVIIFIIISAILLILKNRENVNECSGCPYNKSCNRKGE